LRVHVLMVHHLRLGKLVTLGSDSALGRLLRLQAAVNLVGLRPPGTIRQRTRFLDFASSTVVVDQLTIGCDLPCSAVTADDGRDHTPSVAYSEWRWCGVLDTHPVLKPVMPGELKENSGSAAAVLLYGDECILLEGPDSKKAAKGVSFAGGWCVRAGGS
jgi:hypothetical protein